MKTLSRVFFALLTCCLASQAVADAPFADRVLVNGNILTVDAKNSIAEAIAISDGRIMAVGTTTEIEALAGPGTDRIDLDGLTATPGLLDSHVHFSSGGLIKLTQADLTSKTSGELWPFARQRRCQANGFSAVAGMRAN